MLLRATFINMLAETASLLRTLDCAQPGLLATDGIVRSGVFHDELAAAGLEVIVPDEPFQRQVMSAIYDYVKAGRAIPEGLLDEVCDHVLERGADSLILGCTELAFLGIPTRYKGAPVADTIDVLAWRSVIECGAPRKGLDGDLRLILFELLPIRIPEETLELPDLVVIHDV